MQGVVDLSDAATVADAGAHFANNRAGEPLRDHFTCVTKLVVSRPQP